MKKIFLFIFIHIGFLGYGQTKLDTSQIPMTEIINRVGVSGWGLTGTSGTTAGTNFIGTTDSVALVLKTNGTERVRITGSGSVNILGSNATPFSMHLPNANYNMLELYNDTYSATTPAFNTYIRNDGTVTMGTGTSRDFAIFTNDYPNYRLTVKANGDIGIGTQAPAAKLHVVGGIIATGMSSGAQTDSVVTTDASGNLRKRTVDNINKASLTTVMPQLEFKSTSAVTTTGTTSITLTCINGTTIPTGTDFSHMHLYFKGLRQIRDVGASIRDFKITSSTSTTVVIDFYTTAITKEIAVDDYFTMDIVK